MYLEKESFYHHETKYVFLKDAFNMDLALHQIF